MRRAISLLVLVCLVPCVEARPKFVPWKTAVAGGFVPPASPILHETFDAAGYDLGGWTELPGTGTINEDDTTSPSPLEGTQSVRIFRPGFETCLLLHTYTLNAEVSVIFRFRFTQISSLDLEMMTIDNSGGVQLVKLHKTASNTLVLFDASFDAETVGTVAQDVTYFVRCYLAKGAGTNAVFDVSFSTDGTFPTSGDNFASITTGVVTDDAAGVTLLLANGTNGDAEVIYDDLYVDDATP